MDNSPEFVLSWYACAVLGAVAVSTNTRSVARDMSYFAETTEAVCALTQPKFAEMIRESAPALRFVAIADNDAGMARDDHEQVVEAADGVPFAQLFAKEPISLRAPDPRLDLSVQFTSGDRTYKLGSGITSEYGRYVESPGVPVAGIRRPSRIWTNSS